MATKFEQLCAAYRSSRDGFAAYRSECTAFLLRVGHLLESTWEVPSLRLASPAKNKPPAAATASPAGTAAPAGSTEVAFDPATGLIHLDASFDVQAGAARAKRTVTVPLAVRKEGNGFVLSVDDGAPVNVGGGSDGEIAPLLDEAFGRVMARFEQDPRRMRDRDPEEHSASAKAVTAG